MRFIFIRLSRSSKVRWRRAWVFECVLVNVYVSLEAVRFLSDLPPLKAALIKKQKQPVLNEAVNKSPILSRTLTPQTLIPSVIPLSSRREGHQNFQNHTCARGIFNQDSNKLISFFQLSHQLSVTSINTGVC